jgi:hypothetical protein
MTEQIKPVELKDRKIFSPERGLSRQLNASYDASTRASLCGIADDATLLKNG